MPDWEHLFVTACLIPGPDGGQWRPRMINNTPLPDWEQGPLLASFIQGLEDDGWQLARKIPNTWLDQATTLSLLFKRPRQQPSASDPTSP